MGCELGNIYNKEALLQALLDRSVQSIFPHIRGLKDVKTLKITKNPAIHDQSDPSIPYIICPITKLELNGLQPFQMIWSTGFILSEKAIREVGIEALQDEYGPFTESDLIKVLPVEAEMDALRAAMFHRRAAHEEAKKLAKQSKKKVKAEDPDRLEGVEEGEKKIKKRKVEEVATSSSSQPLPVTEDLPITAPTKKASTSSERLITNAMNTIKQNEEKSTVFKSLFHKNQEKDRTDRDLFMTVAGFRYTLG